MATLERVKASLKEPARPLRLKITRLETVTNIALTDEAACEAFGTRIKDCENDFLEYEKKANKLHSFNEYVEDEAFNVSDRYYEVIGKARVTLRRAERNAVNTENLDQTNRSYAEEGCITRDAELERMTVPTFDGNYKNWLTFYNAFKTLIDDNKCLNYYKKFFHLQRCLVGEAADYMKNQKPSETAYNAVLEALKNRYENKRIIVQTHIKALFDITPITNENGADLRNLINQIMLNLTPIHELGRDLGEDLLIYLITSKLDKTTRKTWEKALERNKMPTYNRFETFLNNTCSGLEVASIAVEEFLQNNTTKKPTTKGYRTHATLHAPHGQARCHYCNKTGHFINKCSTFLADNPEMRLKGCSNAKLCTNCLRPGHTPNECASLGCLICRNKHHTLLHNSKNERATNNCQPTDYFALLPTCKVNILDDSGSCCTVRALLDSGSQINLISSQVCNKLKLKTRRDKISIRGFGDGKQPSSRKTSLRMMSRDESFRKTIECHIVNRVTHDLPPQSVDIKKNAIPSNVLNDLADLEFAKSNKIDLLLGVDVFFDLLREGRVQLEIKRDITNILNDYGFPMHKWCSNAVDLSADINQNVIEWTEQTNNKVLGIKWNVASDEFVFNGIPMHTKRATKRNVLAAIGSIFDSLGVLSPIIVRAKMFMQQLWQLEVSWDEELASPVRESWSNIVHELANMNNLTIPQYVLDVPREFDILVFSDASEKAYGGVIYTRYKTNNGYKTNILCAKSRVAPLKIVSVARLELCAALLASHLYAQVRDALRFKGNCYMFTDSTIVLAWISSAANRWKTFVANRVSEIQVLTESCTWLHVSTRDNPLDLITRGVTANDLNDLKLWWNGPSWIDDDRMFVASISEDPQEIPEAKANAIILSTDDAILTRFSCYTKLRRVTAWCLRAIHKCVMQKGLLDL